MVIIDAAWQKYLKEVANVVYELHILITVMLVAKHPGVNFYQEVDKESTSNTFDLMEHKY